MNYKLLMEIAKQYYAPEHDKVEIDEKKLEQWVGNRVIEMSKRGYRFWDNKQIDALEAYGRGYGIVLAGAMGTGKTMFFKTIDPSIVILDMNSASGWKQDDLESFLLTYRDREMLIDDVGAGSAKGKDFGREYDPMMIILNMRNASKKRTHFTTNLDNDSLIKNLDYRAYDRMLGLAKFLELPKRQSLREPFQKF